MVRKCSAVFGEDMWHAVDIRRMRWAINNRTSKVGGPRVWGEGTGHGVSGEASWQQGWTCKQRGWLLFGRTGVCLHLSEPGVSFPSPVLLSGLNHS